MKDSLDVTVVESPLIVHLSVQIMFTCVERYPDKITAQKLSQVKKRMNVRNKRHDDLDDEESENEVNMVSNK